MRPYVVLPFATLLERAKESSLGYPERGSIQVAAIHGPFDMGNLVGLPNFHCELSEVQFDVFIAADILHVQLPRHHSNKEVRGPGYLDRQPEIIVWAAADAQVGPTADDL